MHLVQDNLYPLAVTLALTAAVICWFNVPEPAQPKAQAVVIEPWHLPELTERDRKTDIQTITTRSLWGADVVAAAPKAPEWRVLGIARSGADRYVLLAYEGKPIEILKVGDALPDGLKIVDIENDRFFVATADKKKIAFGIYKNDPPK
jgi:hypothetical protein